MIQTEFEFELPKGYIDDNGTLHRKGRMRLATAADEILPYRDPRVRSNPRYLNVIVISRVLVELGELKNNGKNTNEITPNIIENLFVQDFNALGQLYQKINSTTISYPLDKIYEEIAFIAYYFHWSFEEILNMEHETRTRWVQEISKINSKRNHQIQD
jgi:hypothetical protein